MQMNEEAPVPTADRPRQLAGIRAVVWTADGRPTADLDYGTRLVEGLQSLGAEVRREDLTAPSTAPETLGALHVLTGGSTSVNDLSTWMPSGMATLERLLDSAREEELHVLGICLGSQMIAHCIAGSSVGSGVRMEAGITDLQWRDGKGPQVLPSFHYERIEEGPLRAAGAQIEAWNSRVPVLAFTMGPRIGGIQLHPEFDAADLQELLAMNRRIIEDHGASMSEVARRLEELQTRWDPTVALAMTISRLLPELRPGS